MTRSTFRVLFYANGSKEKNGLVGQGSGTPKGSVIPEIHHPKSQEMVSAVLRVGVHGEVLP